MLFYIVQEMITVSVDGSVLDRIAKIMSYLRLGSSGKVLKKKKKEKDGKGVCSMHFVSKRVNYHFVIVAFDIVIVMLRCMLLLLHDI